jgi:hypothetical protein
MAMIEFAALDLRGAKLPPIKRNSLREFGAG